MFGNSPLSYDITGFANTPSAGDRHYAFRQAYTLFNHSRSQARVAWLWSLVRRRNAELPTLAAHISAGRISAQHTLGLRTIPVAQISGGESPSSDFDAAFRPLQERTRERWLSIAALIYQGLSLPPIEVIQVGDVYFVRDGRHRVSVARAVGQIEIDAHVTVWQIAETSAALSACPVGAPAS